jgi:hypothetical protein
MDSVADVIPVLLRIACPCRFPRFVRIVGFKFEDFATGPVASLDTEKLVVASYQGPNAFLKPTTEWRTVQDSNFRSFSCTVCAASWEIVSTDYSIRLTRHHLLLQTSVLSQVGMDAEGPFPHVSEFQAFTVQDAKTCAASYKQVDVTEFVRYVSESRCRVGGE